MTETNSNFLIANQLKRLLIESSDLFEEYTSRVCPDCTDVCCRQKHGIYGEGDMRYLKALDEQIPRRDLSRPGEGPCEAMGPRGCVQPRWLRPFKCTWYICEPLIAALDEGPQQKARKLSDLMQEMMDLNRALAEPSDHSP